MMHRHLPIAAAALFLFLSIPRQSVRAENVDLSTVPARDTVQLTIYNSEDLTLVRETRQVSFKRGVNPLQFSWANTLIDPTSVELRFLTNPDKYVVLDTTFPHAKPHMLYWNVQSERDGKATVEITYFTSGIRWSADYVGVADPAETGLRIEGFVRVFNNSGEEYENAQVRLIVGKVRLVEKIAELAAQDDAEGKEADRDAAKKLRSKKENALKDAVRKLESRARDADDKSGAAEADERMDEKEVVKESLSEYFLYTIEGTETIPNGWSKRLRSLKETVAPLKIQYRYREPEYGPQLVRMYLLRNDTASQLGTTPLPDGMVRVFRDNGRDGLSFLAAQAIPYVPIGDKIELNLGPDPEVVFELVKLRVWRDNLWLQLRGANVFRRVDEPGVRIEANSTLVGWAEHNLFTQRVRNYSAKPIEVEVRRTFPGHILFRSDLDAKNHDYQTVQYTATVKPGEKADLLYEVVQQHGRNQKQNNVTVERAKL